MAKQTINLGTGPNTKTGDPLRTAFTKINENFTELYTTGLIPLQTGNSGKYLTTNGTTLSWGTVSSGNTGDFVFNTNNMTVVSDDLNIITTRTQFGTDADVSIEAADDVWINAFGDEIEMTAANGISMITNNGGMEDQYYNGDEADFVGTWNASTLTIAVPTSSTTLISKLDFYTNTTADIFIQTSTGITETYVTENATAVTDGGLKTYTILVGQTSPSSNVNVEAIKIANFLGGINSNYWYFSKTGVTSLPGSIEFPIKNVNLHNGGNQDAAVLQFQNVDYQAVITGPTPAINANAQRLIIQGQRGTGTGEGGDVYLWGGDADGTNGGDIKIYAGDADNGSNGSGGYVNIDGGHGYNNGGPVEITGGYSSGGTGGNVNIRSGGGATSADIGSVFIETGINSWHFNNVGTLTLPTGGTISEGVVTSNPTIQLTPATPTVSSQKLVIKGGGAYDVTDNGINLNYNQNTAAIGDTLTFYVYSADNADQTLYWWTHPAEALVANPNLGTVALNSSGYGEINFVLDSDDYEFTIRVSPTENVYDPETTGVESFLINSAAPTYDDNHLHLTTGNLQETSIFLGTDEHNVRTKQNGSVEVTARDYDANESKVWQFNEDGSITFPDNTIQPSAAVDFGGQQTVEVNATTATDGLTISSLTGTIILVTAEVGYTETTDVHVITLPTENIQVGTRITVINTYGGSIDLSGWFGPSYTVNPFGTVNLILVTDGNIPGWWITSEFYWPGP